MTIQTNFPAIKPTLLLDFANTKQLDPRITFTRASIATYYDSKTTAKAEENLLLQSQTLNDVSWSANALTVTTNSVVAPDGTTTAETLTDTAANDTHRIRQSLVLVANTDYACSGFFKKGTHSFVQLLITAGSNNNNWATAIFDLTTGTVSQSSGSTNGTLVASSITNIGNDWYRCSIVARTTSVAPNQMLIGFAPTATGNTFGLTGLITYAGTNTDFYAWGAQFEQRSAVTAYTPTTTQPITNYIPQLLTAASGVARFDHNPITRESLGLEIEESRTNLMTYSEMFSDVIWGKNNGTLTANTLVAPDGTLTADLFFEDTTNASHFITYNLASNFTSGTAYTQSYFVKAKGRTRIQLGWRSDWFPPSVEVNFDLVAKTATPSANATASIQEVGNGWFRITATATADATGTSASDTFFYLADASGNISYTGNGTSGVYIWGAQLETGAFATSYIPTVASQVTRAADAASMTGTNFSSWFNQAEGSFVAAYSRFLPTVSNQLAFMASDGTANNTIFIGSNSDRALITTNNTSQINIGSITLGANEIVIRSIGYKVDDCATSANGAATITDTSALIPVVNQLAIGFAPYFSLSRINGHIRKIAYYPIRVTNSQLQALTS